MRITRTFILIPVQARSPARGEDDDEEQIGKLKRAVERLKSEVSQKDAEIAALRKRAGETGAQK